MFIIIYLTGSQNGNCNIEGDEEVFAVSIYSGTNQKHCYRTAVHIYPKFYFSSGTLVLQIF